MKKCCYVNCDKEATVKGFVYGHHKGERNDSLIPVAACDEHSKKDSFFPDIFYVPKGGNK